MASQQGVPTSSAPSSRPPSIALSSTPSPPLPAPLNKETVSTLTLPLKKLIYVTF